jgi:hypothetical protein
MKTLNIFTSWFNADIFDTGLSFFNILPDLPHAVHTSNPCRKLAVPTAANSTVSIFLHSVKVRFSSRSGTGGVDWVDVAQDSNRWRALVNAVMSLRVPQNAGNFSTSWGFVSFSRRTLLHGVSQSVSQPASQPVSEWVSQSVIEWVSECVCQSVSQSVNQLLRFICLMLLHELPTWKTEYCLHPVTTFSYFLQIRFFMFTHP